MRTYEQNRRERNIGKGTLLVGALAGVYMGRKWLTGKVLGGLTNFSKRVVSNLESDTLRGERVVHEQLFRPAARMASELRRGLNYVEGAEQQRLAYDFLMKDETFTNRYGVRNLKDAFGVGTQRNTTHFNNAFLRYMPKEDSETISHFRALSESAQFHGLIKSRSSQKMTAFPGVMTREKAIQESRDEIANSFYTAHRAAQVRLESSRSSVKQDQRRLLETFKEVLSNEYKPTEGSSELLKHLGISRKTLREDKSFIRDVNHPDEYSLVERILLGDTPGESKGVLNRVGLSEDEISGVLGSIKSVESGLLLEHNGKEYDLSALPAAVSKVYNDLREAIQIPIPGMGGFSVFSFFPSLRGQSHKIFHEISSVARLPQLQNVLEGEGQGNLFIVGKRGTLGLDFKGRGLMLGNPLEGEVDFAQRNRINKTLSTMHLDVRDAQSGFHRRIASRLARHAEQAEDPLLHMGPESALASVLGRQPGDPLFDLLYATERRLSNFFSPGGQEGPSWWQAAKSVVTKFRNPKYVPEIYRSLLEEDTLTDPNKIEAILGSMQTRAGLVDPKHIASLVNGDESGMLQGAPPELARLFQYTGNKLNFENEQEVIKFFSNPDVDLSQLKSQQLRRAMESFRVDPEGTFGYGVGSNSNTLLDEINFNPYTSFFGKGEKVQGLSRLRNAVIGELGLHGAGSQGSLANRILTSKLDKNTKTRYLALLEGTRLREVAHESSMDSVFEELKTNENLQGLVSNFINLKFNRFSTFVDEEEASLGTRLLVMHEGKDPLDYAKTLFDKQGPARQHWQQFLGHGLNALSKGATFSERINSIRSMGAVVDDTQLLSTAKGLFKGFDSPEDFTANTSMPYFLTTRLDEMLTPFGMGIGQDDLQSTYKAARALMFKRAVPAYLAVRTYDYLNYEADRNGYVGPDEAIANVRAHAMLGSARLSDNTGFTAFKKRLSLLTPGTEEYLNFRPRSEEETKAYLDHGYDPVRKGRGWLFGSRTPFMGDSVSYYETSFLNRAASDWQSAAGGSRSDDSFKYSWLPSLRYPLAPLNALLHPYGREELLSVGENAPRPYVLSAPLMDPNLVGAPIVNAILGPILKPQKELNPEILDRVESQARQNVRAMNSTGLSGANTMFGRGARTTVGGGSSGGGTGGGSGAGSGGGYSGGGTIEGYQNEGTPASIVIVGAGGTMTPVAMPGGYVPAPYQNTYWGKAVPGMSFSKKQLERLNSRLAQMGTGLAKLPMGGGMNVNPSDVSDPRRLTNHLDLIAAQSQEMAGIYGYMSGFIPGVEDFGSPSPRKVLADASTAFGVEPRFWEAERGGSFGLPIVDQPLNELVRRFIPHRRRTLDPYNPLPNQFAGSDWLPNGESYFMDFQTGDPYSKVKRGMMRLPGEAYRRLHRNEILTLRASAAGKTPEEMAAGMMHQSAPMSEYGEYVTSLGTELHAKVEARLAKYGFAVAREVALADRELGIRGHLDAVLQTNRGLEITDLKTVSDKKLDQVIAQGHAMEEHMRQISIYQHITGIKKGRVLYASRDSGRVIDMVSDYDPRRFNKVMEDVEKARDIVSNKLDNREISEGDLYDDVTRYEILSDVAPYSVERKTLEHSFSMSDQLSRSDKDRIASAKKRASTMRRKSETFDYRFLGVGGRIKDSSFTVDHVEGDQIFVKGDTHPLKLAGGHISDERAREYLRNTGREPDEDESAVAALYARFGIKAGHRIRVKTDLDDNLEFRNDKYNSRRVVVGSLNNRLIKAGVIQENENDFTPTGVLARFSSAERLVGSAYEAIAHQDTALNSKFLKVRSPYEAYRREVVYGTKDGSWDDPYNTYIAPTFTAMFAKNPVAAAALGGFMFSTPFILKGERLGGLNKKTAFVVGAAVGAVTSTARIFGEAARGDVFIPPSLKKRRDIDEYFDILTYIKERSLYEKAANDAEKYEGTDIDAIINKFEKVSSWRQAKASELDSEKESLIRKGSSDKERIKELSDEVAKLKQPIAGIALGPIATTALEHRNAYRKTMYGAQPGGPLMEVIGAMPKSERDILMAAMNSPEKDRKNLYKLLSDPQKRLLGLYMGKSFDELPDRPELSSYFQNHNLPGPTSEIWNEDVSLKDLKIRAQEEEGFRPIELGLFPQVIEQAKLRTEHIAVPYPWGHTQGIKGQLNNVLSGKLRKQSYSIHAIPSSVPSWSDDEEVTVDSRIKQDRRSDIRKLINNGY